ncbi:MAG: hypothetical protein B6D44_10485 [Ignavibacteriales bacterium UTCHB2]|nr:MAG: hypothetical protein B6D44_10485 [Ignavibacteriales bacterium UTCHB2]
MNKNHTIYQIENLLSSLINKFQKNTFEYFYEEDIRAELLVSLKEKISLVREFPAGVYSEELHNSIIHSSIIKAEYPSHKKFDIAILDYDAKKDFYNQPVFLAFEIKLGSHKIGTDRTAGFISDIIKLKENVSSFEGFVGVAIYFCQTSITKINIDKWYKGWDFNLINVDQLNLNVGHLYAIIVPGETSGEIFLSSINKYKE